MALPEIVPPDGTPDFLADGHSIDESPQFAAVAMRTGHSRARRLYTAAEKTVAVGWNLDPLQMARLDDWFENVLLVGSRFFSARIKDQTADAVVWWKAKWAQPWQADPVPGGRWRVTGQLQLFGEASATAPPTTSLALSFGIALTGRAALMVNQPLAASFSVALTKTSGLAMSMTVSLLKPGAPINRESGGNLQREDGSDFQRE